MEQSSATVTEGDVGSVCAELQALPVGGTERDCVCGVLWLEARHLTIIL